MNYGEKYMTVFIPGWFHGAIKAILFKGKETNHLTCFLYRTPEKNEIDVSTYSIDNITFDQIKTQRDLKKLVCKRYVMPNFSQVGRVNFDGIQIVDIHNPQKEDYDKDYYYLYCDNYKEGVTKLSQCIHGPFSGYERIVSHLDESGLLNKEINVFYFKRNDE